MKTSKFNIIKLFLSTIYFCFTTSVALTDELPLDPPQTFFQGDSVDYTQNPSPQSEKGAALLVWQKNTSSPSSEIVILSGEGFKKEKVFKTIDNYFHIMVYFDRPYQWKVRYLNESEEPLSEYSTEMDFQVTRRKNVETLVKSPTISPKRRPFGKNIDPEKIVYDLPPQSKKHKDYPRKPSSTSVKEFIDQTPKADDNTDYSY